MTKLEIEQKSNLLKALALTGAKLGRGRVSFPDGTRMVLDEGFVLAWRFIHEHVSYWVSKDSDTKEIQQRILKLWLKIIQEK